MVCYLVMINNCKRLLRKKSTYLVVMLLPIFLIVSSLLMERIGKEEIRVGVVGSEQFVNEIRKNYSIPNYIYCKETNSSSINTDQIMGTYQYIITENMSCEERNLILNKIQKKIQGHKTVEEHKDTKHTTEQDTLSDTVKKKASMLLMIYMIIAVIYNIPYINDKKAGLLERVKVSGGTRIRYMSGYLLGSTIIIVTSLIAILAILKICDDTFICNLFTIGKMLLLITVIVNLYSFLIVSISKSELMAGILGSSVTVVLALIGGAIVPMESMPKIIQTISIISPIKWLLMLLG